LVREKNTFMKPDEKRKTFNVDKKNKKGQTLLWMASDKNMKGVVLFCLLRKANPKMRDKSGVNVKKPLFPSSIMKYKVRKHASLSTPSNMVHYFWVMQGVYPSLG
jgi:hypothetical protein